MVRLTVVPVIPLALSDASITAIFAISSSVMSRRGCVLTPGCGAQKQQSQCKNHSRKLIRCYCLMTVPSRRRTSPQPPFRFPRPAVKGAFAAAFSSTSIPQPGFSFA